MSRFALLLLAPVLLCGCRMFSSAPPKHTEEVTVGTRNSRVLFEAVVLGLQKEGFSVGQGADPGKNEVVTGWRVNASPFKGKGYRERATVNFSPAETEGESLVTCRVERETNESFRPLLEGSAKWERAPDPEDVPKRVLAFIDAYLQPGLPQ
ncbi:MAG: hypothetical protein R3F17_04035 [Planctomycetota bacterium]